MQLISVARIYYHTFLSVEEKKPRYGTIIEQLALRGIILHEREDRG